MQSTHGHVCERLPHMTTLHAEHTRPCLRASASHDHPACRAHTAMSASVCLTWLPCMQSTHGHVCERLPKHDHPACRAHTAMSASVCLTWLPCTAVPAQDICTRPLAPAHTQVIHTIALDASTCTHPHTGNPHNRTQCVGACPLAPGGPAMGAPPGEATGKAA
eukprot:366388-Chlamydomonas_euryale.AAC.3